MSIDTEKPKEKKKPPTAQWVNFFQEDYERALRRGIHYSSKLVNSNAEAVGVRLPATALSPLPGRELVAFATTKLDRRITDFSTGGAAGAKIYAQMNSVLGGSVADRYLGCSAEQKEFIHAALHILEEGALIENGRLDPRLRQVHFPVADGTTVLLTPLHSGIFSSEVNNRSWDEVLGNENVRKRRTITLGIGGSNSQNAGIFARAAQTLLEFPAPRESMEVRIAFATFYQGVSIASLLPADLLDKFGAWRNAHIANHSDWTLEIRLEEEEYIQECARIVLEQADQRAAEVAKHAPWLESTVSAGADDISLGLLDRSKRTKEWREEFAASLVSRIELYRKTKDSPSLSASGALSHHIKTVKECAR